MNLVHPKLYQLELEPVACRLVQLAVPAFQDSSGGCCDLGSPEVDRVQAGVSAQ